VHVSVAGNANTPVSVLEKLVEDENVRWAVARNENTPVTLLEKLAQDKDEDVRKAVTENPNFTS
jgi:succinylglutamate desuccinylase